MKKFILNTIATSALILAFSASLFSQSTIRGVVKSGTDGTPLENVPITIGGDLVGLTDAAGNYSFGVASGTNILAAVYNGNTISKTITFAPGNNWMNFWFDPPSLPSDFDGNYYHTVAIGTQTWLVENLLVTHFRDGTNIPNITDNTQWNSISTARYCWYNNDADAYKNTYGALYNWPTVITGNLCPTGWHVPSDGEWTSLETYLGGSSVAGGKLKEEGYIHWLNPNLEATNQTGFTALPGGRRDWSGTFDLITGIGLWWSTSDYTTENAWYREMNRLYAYTGRYNIIKMDGLSVRCVNDPPTATINGTTAVCMGTASPNITFTGTTGTAPFTFTYKINSGTNQTVTTTSGNSVTVSVPTGTAGAYTYSLVSVQDIYITAAQTGSAVVTINPLPTANAGAALSAICQGGTSSALGGSVGGSATGGTWSTPAGGIFSPNATTLNATWTPPGTYSGTATLTLTTTGGSCATATGSKTITVNPKPAITAMTTTVCSGAGFTVTPVNVTNGTVPAGTTYSWAAPTVTGGVTGVAAGTAAANISGTLTNPTNTAQTATYIVTPTSGSCVGGTFIVTVTINPTPSINNFGISMCSRSSFSYTPVNLGMGIVPAGTTYSWPAPSVTGSVDGVAAGTGATSISGTLTNLTDITQTSIYTVTPTSGSCIGGTFTLRVTIYPSQTVNVGAALSAICQGGTTTALGGSYGGEATAAVWSDGGAGGTFDGNGGTTPDEATYSAAFDAPPSVTLTLTTVGESCGTVFASKNLTVNPNPAITDMTTTVCSGAGFIVNPVDITNGTVPAGTTYSWPAPTVTGGVTGGAGGSGFANINGTLINPTNTAQTASYTITPTSSSCVGATFTVTVTVNPLPAAPIVGTITQPTCALATGSVDLSGLPASGTWILTRTPGGTTTTGTGTSAPITGLPSGTYTYKVTNTDGCISVASGNVVINAQPITPTAPTVGAITQPTCALATGGVVLSGLPASGTWTLTRNPGGTITTGTGPSTPITGLTAGTYTYTVTNADGCISVASGNVAITAQPITPTAPTVGAITQPTCALATGGVVLNGLPASGTWTVTRTPGGTTTTGTGPSTPITGLTAGTYTYTVTNASGCISPASGNVVINGQPVTPTAPTVGTITQPTCVTATGSVVLSGLPAGNWTINPGALAGSTISTTLSGLAAGTHNYTVINESGCTSPASGNVVINAQLATPTATASSNGPIIPGTTLSLTGGPGGMTVYAWTGPYGFSSALQSPVVSTSATTDMAGVYTLTVTNSSGCQSSATTTVTSNPLVVYNLNDNGIGSLRYAINYANSTVGVTDIITFDIPGYGPFTIQPLTPLPQIIDPVIIDGYSQPGASASSSVLLIEVDGTNAGAGSIGLIIRSGNCTVKGLVINQFAGAGIQITNSGGNLILGNYIGVDVTGASTEGNSGDGIQINGTSNNKIGGTNPGEGNIISGNKGAGISILSNGATGNLISSNSIYSNGGLGIDLGGNGVTSNDTGDPDTGPNNLQNFPVLASVISSTGSVTINGSLNSVASKVYNLQFFASKLANNSGYGEGQTFLGSASVTTGTNGNISFTQTFSIKSSSGTVITATATDPLGNTSEFSKALGGSQNQTVPQWPLRYTLNADGVTNITDGSDLNAVRASFQTWAAIPTATISFTDAGTTKSKYANANDGVNLVSFEDDQFPFSYGVLAVAAKTLKIDPTTQTAQIIDADIVVNPEFVNDIKYNLGVGYNNKNAGYFDIQSVVTHEIGHILGLLHSGVVNSTMFFTLGPGTTVRTLEQDDKSWASYSYPGATYNSTFGSISGNITYGYGGQPVAGALVNAINTATKDSVHAYSDASGNYLVPGLIPGSYYIYIEPLDGNVNGYNLRPGNISSYIYANTVYTDYPGEFYSGGSESSTETTDIKTSVSVSAGATTKGINLVTNKDITPPYVVKARATDVSGSLINILSNFSIRFSEPVDETSLSGTSCYLTAGTKTIGGSYTVLGDSVNVVMFDPESVLEYSNGYTLHITGGVKDVKGNVLQPEFTKSFTTVSKDNVSPMIKEVIPENGANRVFVTAKIRVFFSEPMNKASVENGFALNSGGLPVVGSFSWDNDNMSITYTPSGSLKEGLTRYTVTLPNTITDLSGNMLANSQVYSFTTVAQAAPTIIYFGPSGTVVPVNSPIVVDFSEPINIYTFNSGTFKVLLGSTPVQGTFEFLNENSRVIFRPATDLNFSQTYTVILTSGIKDVSQPSLPLSQVTNTFKTAAKATVPDILYLDPPSGVVGAEISIEGSGFDPNPVKNTITFNGIVAPVKTATLTSLTTEVPLGALSGPVQVSVNGTASDNTMFFYLIPQSLDPCSNIIANTSTGTKSTHGTDVTPDGAYAYVTNPDLGKVTAVNLNTLRTTSINVGNTPMNIAINPLGTRAYVTNFNSHTVSVIDLVQTSPTYNTVIKTIPVGIEPYGIVVTPSGKRVYVANYYSGNLSMIDEDPNSGGFDHVVANVSTGSKTGNLAVTPDGAMVLVTGDFGLKIIDSNPKDKDYNSVIANVSSGTKTKDVTATPDAGLAIVLTEEGSLLVVNLHPENGDYSEAVIANVSTGTKGSNVKGSGDGLFVYVTDTDHDQLLVYQIGLGGSGATNGAAGSGLTLILHNKIPVGKAPEGLVINANADRLYVIDTNTSGNREITTVAICCGPITPSKAIGDLIITIQNMINNGNITKLRGYALIVTLNSALRNLYANRPKLELVDLNAFKLLVNTYIKNKQISTAQGNALVNSINAIIAQANGTKSALAEPSLADTEQVIQDVIPVSKLGVIYPNPFSQSITINYQVAENKESQNKVQIMVYDINGRLVSTLVDQMMQSGFYTTSWKGDYDPGGAAPYGTYFVLFRAGTIEEVSKIVLIKPR